MDKWEDFLVYIIVALIVVVVIQLAFKLYSRTEAEAMSILKPLDYNKNLDKMNDFNYPRREEYPYSYALSNDNVNKIDEYYKKIPPNKIINPTKNTNYKSKDYPYQFALNNDNINKIDLAYDSGLNSTKQIERFSGNERYDDYAKFRLPKISDKIRTDDYTGNEVLENERVLGVSNITPDISPCISCDYENTYTKEFAAGGQTFCPVKPHKYSRSELQNYRDDFVGFRTNTMQDSNAGDDPVDRLNEQYLNNNGSYVKPSGKPVKIQEMFDNLTKRKYPDNCVLMPDIDNISREPEYISRGFNGNYYLPNDYVYKYDRIMNGGLFFDDVVGADSKNDKKMAIKY